MSMFYSFFVYTDSDDNKTVSRTLNAQHRVYIVHARGRLSGMGFGLGEGDCPEGAGVNVRDSCT